GNITLADGTALRNDRVYYVIRRAAPDGQAIIQLADTQEDALRGKALQFGSVANLAAIGFAHVRMQEATSVNLQPFHGVDAGVTVNAATHTLTLAQPFAGVQEGSAIVYSGSVGGNGQIEDVLANRILAQGKDVLKVGVTYYVFNLSADQRSFQLRDGQGNLVDFSGAAVGGALQRFSVNNPAGAALNPDGSLTLPKAHGLATGDKVVVNLAANGVLTGLSNDHVYVVEVVNSTTLRFKDVNGAPVALATLGYVSEFNAGTKRYEYFLTDANGVKLLDAQNKPISVNPDAMIAFTQVALVRQTSQTSTSTGSDGTQNTSITQGTPTDATLSASSAQSQVIGENSFSFASDAGLATGDVVIYRSQGANIAGLVDGQRYYVINASQGGAFRYQLASSLDNARDGIAMKLGAATGTGGISLQKAVDRITSGGLISLDIGALTQGHALSNSMLSITVAGAGGKSLGGAGAVGVNISRSEVSAIIDNTGAAAGQKVRAEAGAVSVSAQDASRIVTATGALGISTTQGASAAIGASVSVADMRNDVRAAIAQATVEAQAVQVRAEERASIYNVSVGLAGGAGVAVSGSLAVNTIKNTVHAQIRDSSVTATSGDIRIAARDVA
ncbi:hypothetical protein DAI43_29565, partial [Achromobacter xylosoxidans]